MVSRNGWPNYRDYIVSTDQGQHGYTDQKGYDAAIMKHKAEAVPLDTSHEQTARSVRFPITICDTFIDFTIDVEFVRQWQRGNGEWIDIIDNTPMNVNTPVRTIARVVPERKNGDIWYEGSELKAKVLDEEHSITASQINDECQKHNDELVRRLDAAQARVKQLEQENGEAFAKYQELLVLNRKLKERVRDLESIFDAEWMRVSEVKPRINTAVEVFIPEEDNHITVGMWDVSEKWVLLDEYRVPQSEVTYWRWLRREPEDKSYTPTPDFDGRTPGKRIIDAFDKAWKLRQVLRMNATEVLTQVLDELGIK